MEEPHCGLTKETRNEATLPTHHHDPTLLYHVTNGIKAADVLEYAVSRLSEADISRIQNKVYTSSDRFTVLLEQWNAENPNDQMTREELLDILLKNHQMNGRGKTARGRRQLDLKADEN